MDPFPGRKTKGLSLLILFYIYFYLTKHSLCINTLHCTFLCITLYVFIYYILYIYIIYLIYLYLILFICIYYRLYCLIIIWIVSFFSFSASPLIQTSPWQLQASRRQYPISMLTFGNFHKLQIMTELHIIISYFFFGLFSKTVYFRHSSKMSKAEDDL